jgi:hypothetical protein
MMPQRRVVASFLTLVPIVTLLAACGTVAGSTVSVNDVVAERAAAGESLERARFDEFLQKSGARLDELGLTRPQFQGVVAVDEWDGEVTACIQRLENPIDVARLEGGFIPLNYFRVVGEPYERILWTIESCSAQYGLVRVSDMPAAGEIEMQWRFDDATRRLVPCLRGIGAPVPPAPSLTGYVERYGTAQEWSPYALAAMLPATLAHTVTLCPTTSTRLEQFVTEATP